MRKIIKFFIGIALLPLCWGLATAVYGLYLSSITPAGESAVTTAPAEAWAVPAGFIIWVILFILLPRPFRTYVLAHELTHALWGILMGAKIGRIKIGREGGHVELSKTNFMITLAPYFFPFYAALVIASYYLCGIWLDVATYRIWWMGAVGLTWGFHITFTIHMLTVKQPDILEHGRLFSYTVIFAMNTLLIGLWIVLVASPALTTYADLLKEHVSRSYITSINLCGSTWNFLAEKVASFKPESVAE